jgi:hypothetical protein
MATVCKPSDLVGLFKLVQTNSTAISRRINKLRKLDNRKDLAYQKGRNRVTVKVRDTKWGGILS